MADVLIASSEDDTFWPPSDRTEAQGCEVANHADAWMFGFLGSRVVSFCSFSDRTVVVCRATPSVDAWALGGLGSPYVGSRSHSQMASGWKPQLPIVLNSCFEVVDFLGLDPASNPPSLMEGHPLVVENPPALADISTTVDQIDDVLNADTAISTVKELLGVSDTQIEGRDRCEPEHHLASPVWEDCRDAGRHECIPMEAALAGDRSGWSHRQRADHGLAPRWRSISHVPPLPGEAVRS